MWPSGNQEKTHDPQNIYALTSLRIRRCDYLIKIDGLSIQQTTRLYNERAKRNKHNNNNNTRAKMTPNKHNIDYAAAYAAADTAYDAAAAHAAK